MKDLRTMKYFENITAKVTVITTTENNYNGITITNVHFISHFNLLNMKENEMDLI